LVPDTFSGPELLVGPELTAAHTLAKKVAQLRDVAPSAFRFMHTRKFFLPGKLRPNFHPANNFRSKTTKCDYASYSPVHIHRRRDAFATRRRPTRLLPPNPQSEIRIPQFPCPRKQPQRPGAKPPTIQMRKTRQLFPAGAKNSKNSRPGQRRYVFAVPDTFSGPLFRPAVQGGPVLHQPRSDFLLGDLQREQLR
jgi:hypothetical protein